MRAVAGLPGFSGASHKRSSLALAVLLHGAMLFALAQGLGPSHERPEPREVVLALLPPRAEAPQVRPLTPPAPTPMPKRAAAQVQPQQPPLPQQASEPQPQPLPALRAVFKPHLEDGRAVAAYVLVPINFALR